MPDSGGLPANLDVGTLSRAILEAAHAARIGVTLSLFEAGGPRCIYVNEAAAAIVGWPPEMLLNEDPLRNVAPEDLPRLQERYRRRQAGELGEKSYEITVVRRDGTRADIEVTANSATVGGRPAVFAFVVDITARKEAERGRSRAEVQFRELMEIAPEPIGIIRDDHFVYANLAYAKMLGFDSVAELYVPRVSDLVQPDQAELLRGRAKFIEEGGYPAPFTYNARRRDGAMVLVESSAGPCEYEGKPAAVSMARDVSARKALEAQLFQADRLAAIGTMAAGVAHEINNPLAYVMLNLDWIARKLPESVRDPSSIDALIELLHEAHRGAERVANIVRELRTFSRADGETRRRVDLSVVVRSAIRIAGHEIRHRARVSTSFEPTGVVWANESRLEQVVLNLLLNASHAMPESRADSNEIRVKVRSDGSDRVVLEVIDNGEGIPQEVLPRIFDPFFTTKPRGVGMGLGLSICHGIVMSLGGQITVNSNPHEGTTFRVSLPTTDRDDAESDAAAGDAALVPATPRARVLVVDDEIPIANTMRDLLGAQHDVTATTSGRDALAAVLADRDFDVIFCDLMMPGMSGMDLYEEVRERRPALAKRMVFMTGGAFTARAAEFLATTENRRIEKPFNLGLIERIVREMVVHRTEIEAV
ncbi:MAG TPA: PAS domain S-box protein [Polyangiaceae bacterium]|nr:PAS domain S-box protein [Polyangiaceae bacterium]